MKLIVYVPYFAALLLLVHLIFDALPKQSAAAHRQRLFEIRNNLFILAQNNEIPRDSLAYDVFRQRLNMLILKSEHISLPSVLALVLTTPKHQRKVLMDASDELDRIMLSALSGEDQREIFRNAQLSIQLATARHMLTSSPLTLLTVIAPFLAGLATFRVVRRFVYAKPAVRRFIKAAIVATSVPDSGFVVTGGQLRPSAG